jgi:hypothetical protein
MKPDRGAASEHGRSSVFRVNVPHIFSPQDKRRCRAITDMSGEISFYVSLIELEITANVIVKLEVICCFHFQVFDFRIISKLFIIILSRILIS